MKLFIIHHLFTDYSPSAPHLPSGKQPHNYLKWPSRNSGFTQLSEMVDLSIVIPLKMVIFIGKSTINHHFQ